MKSNAISLAKILVIVAIVGFIIGWSVSTHAAEQAECTGLKIATGPLNKGYSKLFVDINKECGQTVPLCEVLSDGGLDNLDKLSANEADLGIATVDVVNDRRSDENIASLLAVIPLNLNYLHVVVASNGIPVSAGRNWYGAKEVKVVQISNFSDLRGMPIAVVGSAQYQVRKLDQVLGFKMNIIDAATDAAAFDMVKKGQVAAALTISGWPSGTVNVLKQADGLTLAKFDVTISAPYLVKPVNYKNMGVYNVNSLAVPNVLVTRPFKGSKSQDVASLKRCIVSHLQDMQEGSFQPGWKEVKDVNQTYDLPKFNGGATPTATVISTKRK